MGEINVLWSFLEQINIYYWLSHFMGRPLPPIIIVKPRELSRCWKGNAASTIGLPMETLGLTKYYHGFSDKQCGLLTTK